MVVDEMPLKKFSDPFGAKLPALEQNVVKFRAMQMLLVMFYAEELKRDALSLNRVPKGTKNAVGKTLSLLVTDSAITEVEKTEIVGLIDYRNVIGHHMHNLLLDLSNDRVAREMIAYSSDRLPKYDYKAVERLQYFHGRVEGLGYIRGLNSIGCYLVLPRKYLWPRSSDYRENYRGWPRPA